MYQRSRHEKSLHLSLEKWLCAPIGEVVADKATGKSRCVYCDELDPSKDHLATHNHSACYEKGPESRTFYRKDHLRQHLRLMHGCKMIASMDTETAARVSRVTRAPQITSGPVSGMSKPFIWAP